MTPRCTASSCSVLLASVPESKTLILTRPSVINSRIFAVLRIVAVLGWRAGKKVPCLSSITCALAVSDAAPMPTTSITTSPAARQMIRCVIMIRSSPCVRLSYQTSRCWSIAATGAVADDKLVPHGNCAEWSGSAKPAYIGFDDIAARNSWIEREKGRKLHERYPDKH